MIPSYPRARALALIVITGAAIAVACATGGAGTSGGPMASSATDGSRGSIDWKNLPLKHTPEPTSAAITPQDLMTRLYIFADDSMQGRQVGREGNMKGTAYIAREAARLGLQPAGDNGTYFQGLPYVQRHFLSSSTLTANGRSFRWLTDFVAVPTAAAPRPVNGVQAIYGGVAGDTTNQISAQQAAGKLVVLSPAPAGQAGRGGRGAGGRGAGGGGGGAASRFADAAAVATIDLQTLSTVAREAINNPPGQSLVSRALPPGAFNSPDPCATNAGRGGGGRAGGAGGAGRGGAPAGPAGPPQATLRITAEAAAILLGAPVAGMRPGTTGATVSAKLDFEEHPVPQYARNVVAIVRGSDPKLAGEYVAIGGHNDHIGFRNGAVDHDSLRAWNTMRLMMEMQGNALKALTPEQTASIKVNMDSLRRIRPARLDSISNGADDDGSGSMAVLEIAEAVSGMPVKPKRSILFVWHTGEEGGLTGSNYFTANPTVPRDSIVAQLNIDMIGRGDASDMPGGNEDYVGVVGSKRLSTELGVEVTAVNARQPRPLKLDYQFDGCTDWPGYNNIYGRSDHFNYARFNIPIAFFFTGLHQDYHQVTDEPQYIDYPHYARITNYIKDLLVDIADRPRRLVVDKAVTGGN